MLLVLFCGLISGYLYFLLWAWRHLLSLGTATSTCFSSAANSWVIFSYHFASFGLTVISFHRTPLPAVFSSPEKCFGIFSFLYNWQMAPHTYAASTSTCSLGRNFASSAASAPSHLSKRKPHPSCKLSNSSTAVWKQQQHL